MIHLELVTKASEIVVHPPFSVLEDVVERMIMAIVQSGQKLPRVEHVIFEDLHGYEMCIPSMDVDDEVVLAAKVRALKHITVNFAGPEK